MLVVLATLGAGLLGALIAAVVAARLLPPEGSTRVGRSAARRQLRLHPRVAEFLRRRTDPEALTGLFLTVMMVVIIVCAAVVGLLLLMVRAETGLADSDGPLAEWAADQSSETSTDALRLISFLGGTSAVILAGLIVAVIDFRRRARWGVVALLVVVIGGQFAVVNLVKAIVDRARPDLEPLTGFAGASFPSGHSSAAAATYACAAMILGRDRRRSTRVVFIALAVGIAATVATTRVFLGVHWFTDVVAGVVVGWSWWALCALAFGGPRVRFGWTARVAEDVAVEERAERR